jgi:exosortase
LNTGTQKTEDVGMKDQGRSVPWVMLGFCAALLLLVAWDQSVWWRTLEDYSFGYLAPLFCVYVIHERWGQLKASYFDCVAAQAPRLGGWHALLCNLCFGGALVLGGALILLGVANTANIGPTPSSSLAVTLGSLFGVLALLWFTMPRLGQGRVVSHPGEDPRWRLLALLIFPLLVWLISTPIVSVVDGQIRRALLKQVVTVVFWVFDTLGLAIRQEGSVLVLPLGQVGVEEACSGIRSLTGCVFAGSFLGAVLLDRLWQKLLLLLSALLLALVTNLMRSLFLTAWAYNYGAHSIEGLVHDIAGYSVLGLTTIGLLCLIPVMKALARLTD